MGGGDSAETAQTSATEPWGPHGDAIKRLYESAFSAFGDTPRFFPGDTVAAQGAASELSQERAAQMMTPGGGSGVGTAAEDYITNVLAGDYSGPQNNPWMRDWADVGAQDITRHYQTAVAPTAWGAGGVGSGREANTVYNSQRALGGTLSDFYSDFYGRAQQQERGYQQGAAGMAPGVAAIDRADLTAAAGVGQIEDQYRQRQVSSDVERYNFRRDVQKQQVQWLRSMIDPLSGGAGTTETAGTQTQSMDPTAGIMGSVMGLIGMMIMSSREWKDPIGSPNALAYSELIRRVPVAAWRYNEASPESDREMHVGPYAEDWQSVFGTGDGTTIPIVDYLGTLMIALQGSLTRIGALESALRMMAHSMGISPVVLPIAQPEPEAA